VEEKYGLTDRITPSVQSIHANSAEGHGKFGYPNQTRYCMNARGSLHTTLNHLVDACDCHYITKKQLLLFKTKLTKVMGLPNGYSTYLVNLHRNKKDPH
jgi:four helix bundle protein